MLISYLKIVFRNLKKYKTYSFIKIASLSIGIALSMLIFLYVRNEYQYDRLNENLDRIHRIEINFRASMPSLVGHVLASYSPEIEKSVRIFHPGDLAIKNKERVFTLNNCIFADSSFFDIFSFDFISGNPETALSTRLSIVLTESEAEKLFGSENPLGKTVLCENIHRFTVTGIIKDVEYFHIPFQAVASLSTLGKSRLEAYDGWTFLTYVLFPEDYNKSKIEESINTRLKEYGYFQGRFFFRSLSEIYFTKGLEGVSFTINGDKDALHIFITIAIFILLISSVNFINLSTARASLRAKEVGIKKVVGSSRNQLIRQFLFESIWISLIALFFAFLLAELLAPFFSRLTTIHLKVNVFYSIKYLALLIGGAIALGFVSGIYPAFYMNSFHPIDVLKGDRIRGRKALLFRKGLTTFQFAISILLIIAAIFVYKQIRFIQTRDLGFNKDHIITLRLNRLLGWRYNMFKEELLKDSNIIAVSRSLSNPGSPWGGWGSMKIDGKHCPHDITSVDPDYFKTFGFQIVKGRNFSWESGTDERGSYILNETALKRYNLKDPIGSYIEVTGDNSKGRIIGVVRDFHYRSLRKSISPALFSWNSQAFQKVNIRISPQNIGESIVYIEKSWQKVCPAFPFEYNFLDQTIDALYKKEKRLGQLIVYFSVLAIFIACLGIFGLSASSIERKTKEIGIRKVMGASIPKIIAMLTRDFTRGVIVANIIAWPAAFYFMNKWLENFAYRTSIGWWIYALAGVLALVVALLTVSYQAVRAATANPIEALRYE